MASVSLLDRLSDCSASGTGEERKGAEGEGKGRRLEEWKRLKERERKVRKRSKGNGIRGKCTVYTQ